MLSLIQHEVMFYFKNKQEAIYIYSFFISIFLLSPFTLTSGSIEIQSLAPISLWIALATGVALGGQGLFTREHRDGRLEYLQLLPTGLEWLVLAKWLVFYGFLLVPLLLSLPVAGLLFQLSLPTLLRDAIGLSAGLAALSALVALVGAVTSGMEKAGAILSLISVPISVPILIFGAAYCRDGSSLWQPNLMFLLGLTLLLLPAMCIAGAYSIRAGN